MAGDDAPPSRDEGEGGFCEADGTQRLLVKKPTITSRRRLEIRRARAGGLAVKRTTDPVKGSNSSSPSDRDTEDGIVGILAAGGEILGRESQGARLPCLSHGAVSLIGRRRVMEDAVAVAPGFAGGGGVAVFDFFGVYDGHGGARVAQACRERLHVVLAEEVAATGGWPRAEGRWREVMMASFSRVDGEVEAAAQGEAERTVGSTAVVAVVGTKRIVVGNCGDSRAVLSRGGVAVPLSFDHKADRPDEMERVEAAGGRVINWDGYRVLGVLATSRSIGDCYLKPFVISEPDVTVTERTEKDEFLILASDGLWDVVSNEAACKIARQCLNGRMARMFPDTVSGCTAAEAAALLAELAISRGSEDNISVVVVELKRLRGR
ncbi:hypothetical protein OPV22_014178 [Ensete ventricosum]|uniref:protein-serine/threonine phosphatase n=1 Tax=Ensete ventricosum TaxID=4639 RepID=A0AAV8QX67_ENSVE|nr:hypothetical protein OPV22_014178 [Ensete ventricosum]